MAHIETDDGVSLYYEEAGSGAPVIFVHEFAGDHRSFGAQMSRFARQYRCVAYNARGYPPSDVPESLDQYSQDRARDDIRDVLDGLDMERAHLVGVSMGALAVLHFGVHYPERALSLTMGGCGYGAEPGKREQFRKETEAVAARFESEGASAVAETYGRGPARVRFEAKDPQGFSTFMTMLKEHSARGSANTLRGVQARRPSFYDMGEQLRAITVPTLVMVGDEDEPCLDASIYLKRMIPSAALVVLPITGHALNIEEPELYNRLLGDFLHQVDAGTWQLRDPRSISEKSLS
jgi:pimeloyl-ACP methyl ester carboxylesterase